MGPTKLKCMRTKVVGSFSDALGKGVFPDYHYQPRFSANRTFELTVISL